MGDTPDSTPCPTLISVHEAERLLAESSLPLATERVALRAALHRIVREPIDATGPLPPFDQSAMDGFALRASDVVDAQPDRPVALNLTGELRAGEVPTHSIGPRQAVRIMTGAPLPPGADTVVMQEHVKAEAERVIVAAALTRGQNVRYAGEDVAANERVLEVGTELGPRPLALLAALGVSEVAVARRARIAVVATGSELVASSELPGPGQIRDSNSASLSALVHEMNAELVHLERVADSEAQLCEAFERALEGADALLVSGGASVGRHDYTRSALRAVGVRDVFWKIAQKPGKPLYYGLKGDTQVFGLPGNPGAVWLCFVRYVRPALRLRMGALRAWPARLQARLERPLQPKQRMTVFWHGHLRATEGRLTFAPHASQGSHMLGRLLDSNAVATIPPSDHNLAAGTLVQVCMLEQGAHAGL